MADRKKFTRSQQIGESGHALIHRRVAAMGHVWHQRAVDVGIDGEIELFDPATGEATSASVLVQSKAHGTAIPGESADRISYPLKPKDLGYWLKANLPVILVISRPSTDEAWWVDIQAYFADPARRTRARVDIDKNLMAFTGDITDQFFVIADPRGRAYAPGAEERTETLVSNLLSVAIPETYLSYKARVRRAGDAYRSQRDNGLELRHDFVLHGGRLLTWRPAEGTALAGVVEGGPSQHPVGELLEGGPDGERRLVWLLNGGMREDLKAECSWHGQRRLLYFHATDDLSPKKVNTSGSNWRTVFKGYPKPTDPMQMKYFRHSALEWQFIPTDDGWYCALTPTYFYSHDGARESRFSHSYLSGIKRREKNTAVLQETRMWATYLRNEDTLIYENTRILEFGELASFHVDRGITDESWKRVADPDEPDTDEGSVETVSLFEEPA